jgi:hypothetical protein
MHGDFRAANDFAQRAEEKDFDDDGQLGRGHLRIVPRGAGGDHWAVRVWKNDREMRPGARPVRAAVS